MSTMTLTLVAIRAQLLNQESIYSHKTCAERGKKRKFQDFLEIYSFKGNVLDSSTG